MLYISTQLNYKVRSDLKIYKPKELELIFIEIMNRGKEKKNIIIGCIYKHSRMSTEEFKNHILEKTSFENKEVYLLGDFNINLLNYETDRPTAEFLDTIH